MSSFPIHTVETAPAASKRALQQIEKALGFVPNLFGVFAGSPTALTAYQSLTAAYERASLDATERQLVLLTVSRQNDCLYCIAAHTKIAKSQGVPDQVLVALREDGPLPTPKLESLRTFTRRLVEMRGWVQPDELQEFLDAGYTGENVLEVITGIALKTLSNFTNHLAGTPLDAAFAA